MLKRRVSFKVISILLAGAFFFSGILGPDIIMLRNAYAGLLNPSPSAQTPPLPAGFIPTTSSYKPWALKGMKIYPDDPLKFDFLLEEGDTKLNDDQLKNESALLIKYFLAALTLPEEDLWVNLSPFEQDKIIPEPTSQTEMGKGLLEQDYLLKQLVASLMYPETDLGKEFWQRVYAQAYTRFGTTKIPVNTFNKVWIVPDKAVVYEDGQRALIEESRLKVMMEADYLAFKERGTRDEGRGTKLKEADEKNINDLSSQVMKEVVIPALEEEVNTGESFATLRKMYRSFILASWFKKRLKESLLGQVYVDQKKTKGIDIDDPELKERIYQEYLKSYQEGLYNYIRTDYSPQERKHIKRKYWSGGMTFSGFAGSPVVQTERVSPLFLNNLLGILLSLAVTFTPLPAGNIGSGKEAVAKEDPLTIASEREVPLQRGLFNPDSLRLNPDIRWVEKVETYRILRNIEELSRNNPGALYALYLIAIGSDSIPTIHPEAIKLLTERGLIVYKMGGGSLLLGKKDNLRFFPTNPLINDIVYYAVTRRVPGPLSMFNIEVVSPVEEKTLEKILLELREIDTRVIEDILYLFSSKALLPKDTREIIGDYLITVNREGALNRFKERGFDNEEAKRILALARALEFCYLEYPRVASKLPYLPPLYNLLTGDEGYSQTVDEMRRGGDLGEQDAALIIKKLSEAFLGASSPLEQKSEGAGAGGVEAGSPIKLTDAQKNTLKEYFSDEYPSLSKEKINKVLDVVIEYLNKVSEGYSEEEIKIAFNKASEDLFVILGSTKFEAKAQLIIARLGLAFYITWPIASKIKEHLLSAPLNRLEAERKRVISAIVDSWKSSLLNMEGWEEVRAESLLAAAEELMFGASSPLVPGEGAEAPGSIYIEAARKVVSGTLSLKEAIEEIEKRKDRAKAIIPSLIIEILGIYYRGLLPKKDFPEEALSAYIRDSISGRLRPDPETAKMEIAKTVAECIAGDSLRLADDIYLRISGNYSSVNDVEKFLKKLEPLIAEANRYLSEPEKEQSEGGDTAASSSLQAYGGIALERALLDLKTQGQFSGYKFDPAKLKEISASLAGFEPKILSIKRNGN